MSITVVVGGSLREVAAEVAEDAAAAEAATADKLDRDLSNFASPSGPDAAAFRAAIGAAKSYSLLDFIPTNLHAGIAAGTETGLLTTYIQAAIDAGNLLWIGGSFGGGGVEIYAPAGVYYHGALTWKKGVNLRGAGKDHTLFRLKGSNVTGIALNQTVGDIASADSVAWGHFRDIAFFSGEAAPVGQVLWSAVGFSRWNCTNVYWGWGPGCIGISTAGATPASLGGPTSWYNDFYGCHFDKLIAGAGGVAVIFGDTSAVLEQVTTWRFFGGACRGQASADGTGFLFQGATGITCFGVTFESVQNAVVIGSSDPSYRVCQNIEFYGCYWEGNSSNWSIYSGNNDTAFFGGFVTGGTYTDNGTRTRYALPGFERTHLGPDGIDFYEIVMAAGADTLPTVEAKGGQRPGWTLKNDAGTMVSWVNNAASSAGGSQHEFRDNAGASLFAFGTSTAAFAASALSLNGVSVAKQGAAQANSVAATVGDLVTDFNALLAKLRASGALAP